MNNKLKKCPYCGENVSLKAKKCKYCGEWIANTPIHNIECFSLSKKFLYTSISFLFLLIVFVTSYLLIINSEFSLNYKLSHYNLSNLSFSKDILLDSKIVYNDNNIKINLQLQNLYKRAIYELELLDSRSMHILSDDTEVIRFKFLDKKGIEITSLYFNWKDFTNSTDIVTWDDENGDSRINCKMEKSFFISRQILKKTSKIEVFVSSFLTSTPSEISDYFWNFVYKRGYI